MHRTQPTTSRCLRERRSPAAASHCATQLRSASSVADPCLSLCAAVRVSYSADTKLADAGTFVILKEDHTLGNLLRVSLLQDRRVLFAGYRIAHPLEPVMDVKVRVRQGSSCLTVMTDAVDNLQAELHSIDEQFRRQLMEQRQQQPQLSMDLL
jgi:DNA-directed RNA polymerase II subunit RPB11